MDGPPQHGSSDAARHQSPVGAMTRHVDSTPQPARIRKQPPHAPWRFVWGLGLVLALTAISASEFSLRSHGFRPQVIDSPDLWAYHRSRLGKSEREVACLGTSRTVIGFATAEFYRRFPDYNLRMLAVIGRKPAAALLDLAEDPNFRGVVLCDLTWSDVLESNRNSQQDYVNYWRDEYGLAEEMECRAKVWLQNRLVVLNPEARLDKMVKFLLTWRGLPATGFCVRKNDRSRPTNYYFQPEHIRRKREKDEEEYRQKAARRRGGPPHTTPPDWLEAARFLRKPVQQIRARGGQVVFVRYPTSGVRHAYYEKFYPRELYWDRIGPLTSAMTIHFEDYPELNPGDLPDMSHLDRTQAPAFTNTLLDILQRRGILPAEETQQRPQQPNPDYAPPRGRIAAGEKGARSN